MENFTIEELDSHNLKTLINFRVNKDSKVRHYVPPAKDKVKQYFTKSLGEAWLTLSLLQPGFGLEIEFPAVTRHFIKSSVLFSPTH